MKRLTCRMGTLARPGFPAKADGQESRPYNVVRRLEPHAKETNGASTVRGEGR
jgi:hypothetical protein